MVDKITKKITLNLDKVPRGRKAEAKEAVGEYLMGAMLDKIADGKSPVKGERFPRLSKPYADEEKFGDRTPNLDLEGDMLNALEFKRRKGDEIEIGIFKKKEVPKADGHNNFSGKSDLPQRRFVPDERQEFKKDIEAGIKRTIKNFEQEIETEVSEVPDLLDVNVPTETVFSRSIFELVGGDAIIRRFFRGES